MSRPPKYTIDECHQIMLDKVTEAVSKVPQDVKDKFMTKKISSVAHERERGAKLVDAMYRVLPDTTDERLFKILEEALIAYESEIK